jgi:hypothetical protein
MARYLILAQSDVTADALSAWLTLLGEREPGGPDNLRRIVWDRPETTGERGIEAYEALVGAIEAAVKDVADHLSLTDVIVLVDSVDPHGLNAVAEGGGWDSLVAMLILTFPEVRWVFGVSEKPYEKVPRDLKDGWTETEQEEHSLVSLINNPRRCPLFDASGLRNWVRKRTNCALQGVDDLSLPLREKSAAAIDEEKPYAYLHGYTAYRFGYKADVITTWTLMQARFGKQQGYHGYQLLLEDMSLNLPDRPNRFHLLRLADRAKRCPQLDSSRSDTEKSEYRILVTTGQTRPHDTALTENRAYLRTKTIGKGKIIFKPASGLFDIWQEAGLFRKANSKGRRGNATDFSWPPPPPAAIVADAGHGAPGKLLLIAEALIRRAAALIGGIKSVGDAVLGAVFATDALELTGGRTPTTAIDALFHKHQLEIEAECQFSGVEYHLKIRPRLDEITEDSGLICRWYAPREQKNAKLNAEMGVIYGLIDTLRNHNQFDEVQICMNRVRYLHNTLWMRQRPARLLLWPLLRYLELLLRSFAVFVSALLVWVIGLSLAFWWVNAGYSGFLPGLSDGVSSFFAVGPPMTHGNSPQDYKDIPWGHILVACVAIISGFIHLGVFVSHLYSMVARK